MVEFLNLSQAIEKYLEDGDSVAMEGFTHLIPFAAAHEVIRQQKRGLHLIRMTPDLIYDQLIGMGCARHMSFSWGGNPGVGSLHRFRDAIERGWPAPLSITEHSHAALANAYDAGAANMPFAVFRGYRGNDLEKFNGSVKNITCPFTGEVFAAIPAIRPDLAIIHAQRADRKGNVLIEGILGVQKQAVLAAKRALVTVEEVADDLAAASPNSVILPHWTISAIAEVPGGAYPSYAQGYYQRDNSAYKSWDRISREREAFLAWMKANVLEKSEKDFAVRGRKSAA